MITYIGGKCLVVIYYDVTPIINFEHTSLHNAIQCNTMILFVFSFRHGLRGVPPSRPNLPPLPDSPHTPRHLHHAGALQNGLCPFPSAGRAARGPAL